MEGKQKQMTPDAYHLDYHLDNLDEVEESSMVKKVVVAGAVVVVGGAVVYGGYRLVKKLRRKEDDVDDAVESLTSTEVKLASAAALGRLRSLDETAKEIAETDRDLQKNLDECRRALAGLAEDVRGIHSNTALAVDEALAVGEALNGNRQAAEK